MADGSRTSGRRPQQRADDGSTFVRSRLRAPSLKSHLIRRDRLLERLRTVSEHKICLIACPAGFGKTSFLAQWHERETEPIPRAWVTLDAADNDQVVLWTGIVEALRRARPALDISTAEIVASGLTTRFLPRLVNALDGEGDIILVLDDVHRLRDQAATATLAWFVDHAPPDLHLVLSSRSDPPLRLAAMRAKGEVLEFRADDLQFSRDEAEVLLNDRCALGLGDGDVKTLVERTGGWPAGLYLATLFLERQADRHAAVRAFDLSNSHVVDYFTEEILARHDPSTQALLRRSSVLHRLSGPLCDAVTASEGATESLRSLSRANLFITSLGDDREWYQIHPVFRRLLRIELEQSEPGVAPALHRRAAEWHRDRGMLDEAIHHLVEAGAVDEAAGLIAASWPAYLNTRRNASALQWLDRLPQAVVSGDPELLLAKAWLLATAGRHGEAKVLTTHVRRLARLGHGPLRDGFRSVESSLLLLAALYPGGELRAGAASGRRVAELEGVSSVWRPLICAALGRDLYMMGQTREASRWLEEGTLLAQQRSQWAAGAATLAFRAYIAGDEGRPAEQAALVEEGLRLMREHGLEHLNGHMHLAQALVLVSRREFGAAQAAAARAIAVGREMNLPLDMALGLLKEAQVLQAAGQHGQVAAALAEARSIIESCADPGWLEGLLTELERDLVPRRSGHGDLTRSELRVLGLLASDLSERAIGGELYLSRNTVHTHTRSIYRKLGASSRAAAVERAHALGLLGAPPGAPAPSPPASDLQAADPPGSSPG